MAVYLSAGETALLAARLGVRLVFGNAGQDDRIAVGEFSHQRQAPTHGLDGLPGVEIIRRVFFKLGNTVLADAEFPRLRGSIRLALDACFTETDRRQPSSEEKDG